MRKKILTRIIITKVYDVTNGNEEPKAKHITPLAEAEAVIRTKHMPSHEIRIIDTPENMEDWKEDYEQVREIKKHRKTKPLRQCTICGKTVKSIVLHTRFAHTKQGKEMSDRKVRQMWNAQLRNGRRKKKIA